MDQILISNLDKIKASMKLHHVKDAYAFGSVCTANFTDKSDIDFLVNFYEMEPGDYADNYFNLLYQLSDILKRDIDLLTGNSLKNPYFIKVVNHSKALIYE